MKNMAFVSQDKFYLGEVSPEASMKKDVLGSGMALKRTDNATLTENGSLTKAVGNFTVKKAEEFRNALKAFPFIFNRYQSYFCLILPNEESGLTKLRIYDNIGNLMTSEDINLPYAQDDVINVNFYQVNDVMFFYCDQYNIMTLKRLSMGDFQFDTFNTETFKNLTRSAIGLYIYYNAVSGRWEIVSSSSYFTNDLVGKKLFIANNFNAFTNSYNTTSLINESGAIFAKALSFDVTCPNDTTITLYSSENGTEYKAVYTAQVPANGTGTYSWVDDGNARLFKIKTEQTESGKIDVSYAISAFVFYHECIVSEIITEYKAVVDVNYNSQEFQNIFISNNPAKDIVDLAKPGSGFGSVEVYKDVETDNSVPNDGILGLEDTGSVKSVYQTNFKSGAGRTDPVFKYKYTFANASVVKRVRMKGQMQFTIIAKAPSGSTPTETSLELKNAFSKIILTNTNNEVYTISRESIKVSIKRFNLNKGFPLATFVKIDISLENLNYLNIKSIEYQVIIPNFKAKGSNIGAPRYIKLFAFRAQGFQYTEGDQETINRYSYYYGSEDDMKASSGCIYQNRHYVGNTAIIASETASYNYFNNFKSDMTADSSPFIITQNTAKFGKILHMIPFRTGILVLTTEQELFLSAQGALTPSNYNLDFLGERGNENVTPLIVEQGFVGVERGNKLYFQGFNYANESYNRLYLSKYANHLFEGKTIKQIEGLMSGDKTVFILFTDGSMVRLYLDIGLEQVIMAFFRINIDGKISAITAVDNNDRKELWAVVDDRIVKFGAQNDEKPCYLHFAEKFENAEGIADIIVPELDTAKKKIYAVCYDDKGCWFEEVKEAAGEKHILQKSANLVYCGQYYDSGFEALEFGGANDNYAARLKKISKCLPYFVDTTGIIINDEKLQLDDLDNEYVNFHTGKYGDSNGMTLYHSNPELTPTLKFESYVPLGWTLVRLSLSDTGDNFKS